MFEIITGKYTIKQILKDFWTDFCLIYSGRIREAVLENVARVMSCRNAGELGYSVYSCPTCDAKHVVAHTCKSRFCNACGKVKNDEWIIKSQDRLLNVPHKHLVFSIPWELRPFFRP
jgi:hypothetical protein